MFLTGYQHFPLRHLFDVIAAPIKAHATENHKQKQLNAPYLPYLK